MEGDNHTVSTTGGKHYASRNAFVRKFKYIQYFRKEKVFCDVKLQTDDGSIVYGHKMVLATSSTYFFAMFCNFKERHKDVVVMQNLDSIALKLLVDFMYTAKITVTDQNVQVLLSAANLLQLNEVQDHCCAFLQARLHPTNCIGINALSDLLDCIELKSSSESYIQQHFAEMVECDEFLTLSSEQVVKLISSDDIIVPSEEKIFECVIHWVNHNPNCRKEMIPKLLEHVRFPLASREFLLNTVKAEPLLKNSLECKDYIIEALYFQMLKSERSITTMPDSMMVKRTMPRKNIVTPKVILVVGITEPNSLWVECYDPATNRCQSKFEINIRRGLAIVSVLQDARVFAIGPLVNRTWICSVYTSALDSPFHNWELKAHMLTKRYGPGIAALDDCIYAVGGFDDDLGDLKSAEVFDCRTQDWRRIADMPTSRSDVGVGVLDGILYVVGGYVGRYRSKSVDCYDPCTDTWAPIADMLEARSDAGVGVLNGDLYVVGGCAGDYRDLNTVESYSPRTGVWRSVPQMYVCRRGAGVVAIDGLLYVVGGDRTGQNNISIEIYNPVTNTWSFTSPPTISDRNGFVGACVFDKLQP